MMIYSYSTAKQMKSLTKIITKLLQPNQLHQNLFCRHRHFILTDSAVNSFIQEDLDQYKKNVEKRKVNINFEYVENLKKQLKNSEITPDILNELRDLLIRMPNLIHPDVMNLDDNKLVEVVNEKPKFNFKPLSLEKLSDAHDCLETGSHIGKLLGPQSYYFKNCLVDLEQALISLTVDTLVNRHNFELVSVPDLLNRDIIEACGMDTHGERNQVYKIKKENGEADVCLSGTAEMALAGMFSNETLPLSELPLKLASVSRCYRAETSNLKKEKGIFRVHEFTKVEMFAITANDSGTESSDILEEFRLIQTEFARNLGLHFNVLDMAPYELGRPAYRKYDIEAWMPGRQIFGEISSTSNCTDYQSQRLGIQYKSQCGKLKYVHTVNGTACAIPRTLISLMETHQQKDKSILIPSVLQKYLETEVLKPPAKRMYVMRIKS